MNKGVAFLICFSPHGNDSVCEIILEITRKHNYWTFHHQLIFVLASSIISLALKADNDIIKVYTIRFQGSSVSITRDRKFGHKILTVLVIIIK